MPTFASKKSRWGLVVVVAMGIAGAAVAMRPEPVPVYEAAAFEIDAGMLRAGDLVFRRGRSLTSRMVLTADQGATYSHVGIVVLAEGESHVVHAIPGDDFESPMPLRVDSLAAFTDAEAASAVSIRRLDAAYAAAYAERAAGIAFAYARDSVFFDADFNLQTLDAMYCTELVWHAYREAGLDLIDSAFVDLKIPLGDGGPYILPSSLLESPYLTGIFSVPPKPGNRHD